MAWYPSPPSTFSMTSIAPAREHMHVVELSRSVACPLSHRSSEYRHFTLGCFFHFSSHVSIHGAAVRRELESAVSELTGLSVKAGRFPNALQVSFSLSCTQLCSTSLGCQRS